VNTADVNAGVGAPAVEELFLQFSAAKSQQCGGQRSRSELSADFFALTRIGERNCQRPQLFGVIPHTAPFGFPRWRGD
jgi:hypothetical protein